MKLSREGEEGGASGLDERGEDAAEQSFTDVGDEPFIAAPVLEIERGAVLAGRYQIETTIGKGGSGVVLRAFDRIAQAPVAVKILKPELAADPRWVERFSRELRLARQIQHANVCRVFDIGESDGHRFLTMELASEGTLRTGGGRPDAPQRPMAARIADARALVAGMAAIHAAGIVHRDVKPENLLRMEDGRLVVSDFGLATNPAQTASVTLMVGTPSYMAPEMAMGDPASFRSDVWAIGVVMHEILFGHRPEWDMTARERVFHSPVDVEAPPTVRALARLCGECAAESPSARPTDAVEVARRFVRAEQAGAAIASRPFAFKRRWGAAAVVVTLALGIGLGRRHGSPLTSPGGTAGAASQHALKLAGAAIDVSTSQHVARFEGRVHCFSMLPGGRTLRVIVGQPPRAFDLDAETGIEVASPLRSETYLYGCPVLSSDGRELLYEGLDEAGVHQILYSHSPDGEGGRVLTRGTNPEWIPNTDDFVMDLDLTHAAVFSIPVMNSSVVPDDSNGQRRLAGKAVSSRGNLLALRYLDTRGETFFVIHSLPDLDQQASFSLAGSARNQRFESRTDDLEVSIDGPQGNALLAIVDWRAGMARSHAELAGWDLRGALPDDHGTTFLLSRRLLDDLWQYDGPDTPPRRLTTDGENDNVARSTSGRFLIQSRRPGEGYVIMLLDPGRTSPTLTTPGPRDVTPVFSESGDDWFYVRSDRQAIVRCDAGNSCRDIHADPQGPIWPVPSPDSRTVAYLTWLNTPRLKLLSLSDGTVRDLGAAIVDCAPVWADDQHIWVLQFSERRPEWIEIDLRTSRRSGRRQEAGSVTADYRDCSMKEDRRSTRYPQVRVVASESSEIRAIRTPEWQ